MKLHQNPAIELNFDLNDGCNLACRMCGGRSRPSEQHCITLPQFQQRILPLFSRLEAFQFGCQCEPLLVPYFADAVRLIGQTARPDTEGALVTNGTLLTEAMARLLLETPVFRRIRISWDASHRELFQAIRRGADFNRLLDNVKRLIALRNATGSGAKIEFNVTILPENIHDLPAILQLAGLLGIDRVTTNKLFPDDQQQVADEYASLLEDRMTRAAEVARTCGIVFEGQQYRRAEEFRALHRSLPDGATAGRCPWERFPRLALVLEPSGELHSPCRKIPMPLANLLHDDLPAMLEHGLMGLLQPVFSTTDERCLDCYLFEPSQLPALPVHFFTIVLNGEPFIRHHIDIFRQLPFPWHWHIVEGVADLVHDTAWSVANGGRITGELHTHGLSNDGTSHYLDELAAHYPDQITLYRKHKGEFWDGKLEMVNAPLANIREEALLWQVDSDELWGRESIESLRELFLQQPDRSAARLYCDYFVGPRKYVSSLDTWATYPNDWLRVWRFRHGMRWSAHEPPLLVDESGRDVAAAAPFDRAETVAAGVMFQHFAYVLEAQVRFKEVYYGYHDAVDCWQRLQQSRGPVKAADYLPWALPDAVVDDWPATAAPHLAERFLPPAPPPVEQYVSMSVHGATRFEHELRKLFRTVRPRTVIETGTFLGQGTTSIIWRAVRDLGLTTDITTIEVNPEHHRLACEHFRSNGMSVRAELGLSVQRSKLPDITSIHEEFVACADSCGGRIYYDHDEAERAVLYFNETSFDVPENLLEAALVRCNYKPDFVLLDSAGHIGFAEFRHLLALLKGSCHLMLDDINHCKHARTMQEIRRDPRFEILVASDEKFGFAIVRYTDVERLIYLRTDAIGDNILASSQLPYIRQRYPQALITVVCQDRVAPIYDACPLVDGVVAFNISQFYTRPDYREFVAHKISLLQPDMVLNSIFSHDRADDYLFQRCPARIQVVLEGDTCNLDGESLTMPPHARQIPHNPADLNELDYHRTFLRGLGIDTGTLLPQVWTSSADEAWADRLLQRSGIAPGCAIMFFPGSHLGCKRYPHYGKVLAQLYEHPLIMLGGEELREVGDELCQAHGSQALNLAGKTSLGQMAALMKRGKLYLGSDSAGMHIACAVELRNVVLLGGGHFGRFCPYSSLTTAVCLPLCCYQCNWQCPHKRVHCLHDIRPETVLQAIDYSLAAGADQDEPAVFPQRDSTAADSPPHELGALKGRFKIAGESGCVANR